MAVDGALRIARGARGVEQADAVPLVFGAGIGKRGIAGGDEALVFHAAEARSAGRLGIGDVDDDRPPGAELLQRRRDGAVEFAIGEKQLGLAVLQAECDQRRVEADVDGIEDRADHRRRVVGFEHGGRVGGEDGDRVAALDAGLGERVRQLPGPRVEFPIGETPAAMDDGRALAEEIGRPLQKTDRAQRHEIRRTLPAVRACPSFMWNACLTARHGCENR